MISIALSPLYFILILLIGMVSSFALEKISKEKLQPVKYLSIDGLRGYLAFFVFIGHSAIWYFYLKTGRWTFVNSKLFYASASVSVLFFFMITGFLFFLKLINDGEKPIDWLRLYISRLTRLVPLYYFACVAIVLIVFIITNYEMREPLFVLLRKLMQWFCFTMLGTANINGYQDTSLIIAHVVWSLQYEWMFYLALPLLNLFFLRQKNKYLLIVINLLLLIFFVWFLKPDLYYFNIFIGGLIAAFVVKKINIKKTDSRIISLIIIFLTAIFFAVFKINEHQVFPTALLFLIFIAMGNSIFGILTTGFSRLLGQISYSIYLLLPILLFITFKLIIGDRVAKSLTALEFWGIVGLLTPVLIIVCYGTFKFIEEPSMKKAGMLHQIIQRKFSFKNA